MKPIGGGLDSGLRLAIGLFTAIPVPAQDRAPDRRVAARAVLWLPVIGLLVGGLATLVLVAVRAVMPSGSGGLLAATLAITVIAVATRGLHLDGLADTADGLGSAADAPRALEIMRRSDIGPFGVVTAVLVLLVQIASLTTLTRAGASEGALAIVVASISGRLAVLLGSGRDVPSARPEGFGALVASSLDRGTQVALGAATLVAVAGGCYAIGNPMTSAWGVGGAAVGLVAAGSVRRFAVRRLGGVTGDVFGALVEIGAAATLITLALTVEWSGLWPGGG